MAGFVAPAGTPGAVVNTLNQAINEALADPQVRSRLAELSILPQGGSVAHFTQLMRNENVKWKQVIKDAGIKLQEAGGVRRTPRRLAYPQSIPYPARIIMFDLQPLAART